MQKSELTQIFVDQNVDVLVQVAEKTGTDLARPLSTSQIRNIFGEVRRIQMKWPAYSDDLKAAELAKAQDAYRQTVLLRPKLAYQAKRERGNGVEDLRRALDPCLELIQKADSPKLQKEYFDRFVDFFEAILAYHRAAGGK